MFEEKKINIYGNRISLKKDETEIAHAFIYFMNNDLHKESFAFIEDVFVENKYRGQGFGKQLMQQLIALAKKNNCYKIICTSRSSRMEVHKFYLKLGFSEHGKEFRLNLS